jgi:ubiquinone/menaquinone biosynthesis C-methylase UbiE
MKTGLPKGYQSPTGLPPEEQREQWQRENRAWWEANPMRYDWNEALGASEFTRAFYDEIDRRFFEDASRYLPARVRPFDQLVPFDRLPEWDVLEIGVGNGSHAQLLAPHCRSYTGIDLTDYAVKSTASRFEMLSLRGRILRMDAEQMTLPDASFDFIWTWGVIHHSADTGRVLREMHRVLRPGGTATIMVYHRSWLYTYVYTGLLRGVLQAGLLRHNLHELLQLNTDGAIARFYRADEWVALVERCGFAVDQLRIMGQKSEVVLLPAGRLKNALMRVIPDPLSRLVTNRLRQGSFLVTRLRKP